jgi:NTE family protein
MSAARRPRIGLALGSGSARGLAHIGVIRAIEEAGIPIHCIAGTSMGALIGAVHAAGKLDELEATFQAFDWKKTLSFFDVVLPKSGLLDGAKISELVRDHVRAETLEALLKPFNAVATDIASGEEVVIASGDVIEAVRASISVPGIFTPVRSGERVLVDGGLTNPVPVSVARAMGADIVIAVDLNHQIVAGKNLKPLLNQEQPLAGNPRASEDSPASTLFARWVGEYRAAMGELRQRLLAGETPLSGQFTRWLSSEEALPSIFEVLLASINIMETRITQTRLGLDHPEVLIQPPLGHIRFLEFGRAEEIIAIGYEHAKKQLLEYNRI